MGNKKESMKPKKLQYGIYRLGSTIMCAKLHTKVNRDGFKEFETNRDKKDGYLVIYNHACDYDHWAFTKTMGRRLVNNVLAKYFLFKKKICFLLNSVRCIYKDQFVSDLASIRLMKRALDRPGIVALAPAGQMSGDGGEQFISKSIVKLIRLVKKDILCVTINGGHFKKPKWASKDNVRKEYKMNTIVRTVMKKEELSSLTDDEIYDRICKFSNYNCYDYQKEHMDIIKGKNLAKGLENLLYICPKCGKKHFNTTFDNEMKCSNCGNTIIYNNYGFLESKTIDDVCFSDEHKWNMFQKEVLKEHLRNNTLEELIVNVKMKRNWEKDDELVECGEGRIHLGNGFLYYEGTFNNESYRKDFDYNSVYLIPHALGKSFYCPDTEGSFEFWPTEKVSIVNEIVQRIDAKRELQEEEGIEF